MFSHLRTRYLILSSLLLVPGLALPAALSVNGTCEVGSCASVDAITYGQSIGPTSYSFTYTVNSDSYNIFGNYSAAYDDTGTSLAVSASAKYLGSTPTAGTDLLTVNFFQNYFDDSPGTWDGAYTESAPFNVTGNVGQGSTVTAQLFYDGQGLGLLGPFGPGSNFAQKTTNLAGLDANTLTAQYTFAFNFTAGTQPGAVEAVSPTAVPEPAQFSLLSAGLLGFLAIAGFRRERQTRLSR